MLLRSSFLTDTESVRYKDRVAVDSFHTSMSTQLEQVMYTSSVTRACYATDPRSKMRFSVEGGGFAAPLVLNFDKLKDPSAHCTRWSV